LNHARVAELAPEVSDMDIDDVGLKDDLVAPNVLEEGLTGEHLPRVSQEVHEDLEFLSSELDWPIAAQDLPRRDIAVDVVESENIAAVGAPTAEYRPDARQQFVERERLGDVVVGPGAQGDDLVCHLIAGGKHYDRDVRRAPNVFEELEAIEPRKANVEQDDVRRVPLEDLDTLSAVMGGHDTKALEPEASLEQRQQVLVIVDKQDSRHVGLR
jgi:hypothetical protein